MRIRKISAFLILSIVLVSLLSIAIICFIFSINQQILVKFGVNNPQLSNLTFFLINQDSYFQTSAPYLLAILIILSILVPFYLVYHKLKLNRSVFNSSEAPYHSDGAFKIRSISTFLLILAFLTFVVIEAYVHLTSNLPVGTDARIYLYQLETVTHAGNTLNAWKLINYSPSIITFAIFTPFLTIGSWEQIIRFAPFGLVAIYLITTFFFTKKFSKNILIASISTLFAALSLHTLALSTVLFKNMLSLSLLLFFFAIYLQYFSNYKKRYLCACSILLLLICDQEAPTAIVITITVFLFIFSQFVYNRKTGLKVLLSTVKMYIPIPIAILVLDAYNYYLYGRLVNPISSYLPTMISNSGFSLNSLLPWVWVSSFQNAWQATFLENSLLLILAIVGVCSLSFSVTHEAHKSHSQFDFKVLLLSWVTAVSIMLLLTNLTEGYRFVLYYPTSIVGAIGILFVFKYITNYIGGKFAVSIKYPHKLFTKTHVVIKMLVVCILTVLLLNGAIVRSDSSSYFSSYSLSSKELDAFHWVVGHYAPSQNVVFVMKSPGWSQNESLPYYWQWANYFLLPDITNRTIYVGNLFDLLSGLPSQGLANGVEKLNFSLSDLSHYSVILIDGNSSGTFYRPDIVEANVLSEVYPCVYELDNLSSEQVSVWNATWHSYINTGLLPANYLAFDDSLFSADWDVYQGSLVSDANGTGVVLHLDAGQTNMWLVHSGLSINSSAYKYLEITADPCGGSVALDFYGADGAIVGRFWDFSAWVGLRTQTLDLSAVTSGKEISRIAVVFISDNSSSICHLNSIKLFSLDPPL